MMEQDLRSEAATEQKNFVHGNDYI